MHCKSSLIFATERVHAYRSLALILSDLGSVGDDVQCIRVSNEVARYVACQSYVPSQVFGGGQGIGLALTVRQIKPTHHRRDEMVSQAELHISH
ncbi:MAG: hypothetical protein QOG67_357 [Verrucomicrobiota bacterium]